MLATNLTALTGADIPGVADADDLVAGLDTALAHGLGRVDDERAAALAAFAGAFAGSPLGDPLTEAVGKVVAGSVGDEHLAALAGGRAALLGAAHDALRGHLDAALGRTRQAWQPPAGASAAPGGLDNLLAGTRSWLRELVITGWRGVDHDIVSTAGQVISALLAVPAARRLAVLLDGLAAELRVASPVSTMPHVPLRRWGDLWSRATLLAHDAGWAATPDPVATVSGRLLVLGVDVHEHSTAVQAQVHGVLEVAGTEPRLVRASVGATKTDTIVGPAVWRLFGDAPVLKAALADRRVLELTDVPLLASGDLLWRDGQARAGEPADPFATARVLLAGAVAPAVPPLDRHPVALAEPVLLEGYRAEATEAGGLAFDLGGARVAVAVDRLPSCGPLTADLVAASSACLGLLRWDAGAWSLQPLAVQAIVKKKPVGAHNGDWAEGVTDAKAAKAYAAAGDSFSVLRERAGRLLRT
ncbi:hypothetical protein [Luedemannella helvata]|uniref:Uncharacterized protein n=1 Tax=Luedemannella helvata TaxID=349315 RepID=A0ABP4X690_9ACTN